jgi:hypothetical protein
MRDRGEIANLSDFDLAAFIDEIWHKHPKEKLDAYFYQIATGEFEERRRLRILWSGGDEPC